MKWAVVVAAVTWAGVAQAQTPCPPTTWVLPAAADDTLQIEMVGRTITAATVTISCITCAAHADADPSGMIVSASTTTSGAFVSFKAKPDQGCGTAGCRLGNQYMVQYALTDSNSNHPVVTHCLYVRNDKYKAQ